MVSERIREFGAESPVVGDLVYEKEDPVVPEPEVVAPVPAPAATPAGEDEEMVAAADGEGEFPSLIISICSSSRLVLTSSFLSSSSSL